MMKWYDYFEPSSNFPIMRTTLGDGMRRLYRLDEPLPDTLLQLLKQLEARADDADWPQNGGDHHNI